MLTLAHSIAYTLAALWLLTGVGNWLCQKLFLWTGLRKAMEPAAANGAFGAGWIIGWLERLALAAGILAGSWEILAAVIALKSVARFKELDNQLPAEYFLVGSLFSILWAMLVTSAWIAYDRHPGADLRQQATLALRGERPLPPAAPAPMTHP